MSVLAPANSEVPRNERLEYLVFMFVTAPVTGA
jgi:hypothetical protein